MIEWDGGRERGAMRADYTSLPGFEQISLEDSYVLDIEVHPGALTIKLDLLLLPDHPEHRAPLPGERACFRPATITFSPMQAVHWVGQGAPPATDASGTPDFGSVDSMTRIDDGYQILGDWGEINLQSTMPTLAIQSDPKP
ncbi:hypothetical protein [Streptomyces sp. CMB-StM0423]|uniref:hypothetical protein n=1 Tax=Streptomyces sp. CMB-StM0423 TaxID=2059884 RepID=UPI00131B2914|nr:hypothetical protein [Streptomyces sp. CMB-StM0423]